jgi:hypothetical protein
MWHAWERRKCHTTFYSEASDLKKAHKKSMLLLEDTIKMGLKEI